MKGLVNCLGPFGGASFQDKVFGHLPCLFVNICSRIAFVKKFVEKPNEKRVWLMRRRIVFFLSKVRLRLNYFHSPAVNLFFSQTTRGLGIGHVTERRAVTFASAIADCGGRLGMATRPPVVCEKKGYSSKTKLAPSTLLTRSNR